MKKKGFTLIELLAVIVILAVIILISTPVIIKVIERARKGAFEDSAYGVVEGARLYFVGKSFEGKVDSEGFTFPEDTKLKLSGERPKTGSVVIDENGKVELAISNGKWCAVKNKNEEKVKIIDYSIENCKLEGSVAKETCFTVSEDGSTITDYLCENTAIIIPEKINDKKITQIV